VNVEARTLGGDRRSEIVVAGAHYDSVLGCPGADDNATGVAALLELARTLRATRCARTVRFVFFASEEPPHFEGEEMGSRVYARACKERGERVVAMLSLESLGCYSDEPGSQSYPAGLGLLYPSRGNFVAFVGNLRSRGLVRESIRVFRRTTAFPSERAATFGWIPGVGWSDHASFWVEGIPAAMVTDTAPFRNPRYHTPNDAPESVDFARLARVVAGLTRVVRSLGGAAD
jgi:Zn-dependent M28 family amino/carboxypeptidase